MMNLLISRQRYKIEESMLAMCAAFILAGQSSSNTISDISVSDRFTLLTSARSSCQRSTSESMPHRSTIGHTSTRPSSVAPYHRISALHGLGSFVVLCLSCMNANLKFETNTRLAEFGPPTPPEATLSCCQNKCWTVSFAR